MRAYIQEYKKTILFLGSVLVLLTLLTYAFFAPQGWFSGLQNDLGSAVSSDVASYVTLDGLPVDLAEFKGKPLIVNMWATWMPFSKDELLILTSLRETYGDRVAIVAMNRMEDALTIRSYLGIYGIPESLTFLIDQHDSFYKAVGGYAMPETLFYRKDGTLMLHKRGTLTKEELEIQVEELLK